LSSARHRQRWKIADTLSVIAAGIGEQIESVAFLKVQVGKRRRTRAAVATFVKCRAVKFSNPNLVRLLVPLL
jgi:hypothetical protein